MVQRLQEIDARDWTQIRLAIYAGNLKRGAAIRELRTHQGVSQTELRDELFARYGHLAWDNPRRIPWSDFFISTVERGIGMHLDDRRFFALKLCINHCAKSKNSKLRRKLQRRAQVQYRKAAAR